MDRPQEHPTDSREQKALAILRSAVEESRTFTDPKRTIAQELQAIRDEFNEVLEEVHGDDWLDHADAYDNLYMDVTAEIERHSPAPKEGGRGFPRREGRRNADTINGGVTFLGRK